jgi:hypothetical protein
MRWEARERVCAPGDGGRARAIAAASREHPNPSFSRGAERKRAVAIAEVIEDGVGVGEFDL